MVKIKRIISFVAIVIGIYLADIFFKFIPLPSSFASFNNLVIGIGGILLVLYGLSSLMNKRKRNKNLPLM